MSQTAFINDKLYSFIEGDTVKQINSSILNLFIWNNFVAHGNNITKPNTTNATTITNNGMSNPPARARLSGDVSLTKVPRPIF